VSSEPVVLNPKYQKYYIYFKLSTNGLNQEP